MNQAQQGVNMKQKTENAVVSILLQTSALSLDAETCSQELHGSSLWIPLSGTEYLPILWAGIWFQK
jgi:hypothetical protein